jgi:hypothetical protein
MLTAFPIQSLGDAPAMVAFSHFPAALATVAEIYVNPKRRCAPLPKLTEAQYSIITTCRWKGWTAQSNASWALCENP